MSHNRDDVTNNDEPMPKRKKITQKKAERVAYWVCFDAPLLFWWLHEHSPDKRVALVNMADIDDREKLLLILTTTASITAPNEQKPMLDLRTLWRKRTG